jgi:hypothetical protein
MFLLYFVLVSSGVTFMMNQWRQFPSYQINVHEFTSELPKYMMMTCSGSGSDYIQSPRSFRRFAKNTVAGNDMRFPKKPSNNDDDDDSVFMESFHRHMHQKKMLDYLENDGDDALVKLHMYQEYTKNIRSSITCPCLQAGNWKDLEEFDFSANNVQKKHPIRQSWFH